MPKEYKTTEDILAAGEEKKLITREAGRITYEGLKEKKTYQFTDPEEQVRAKVYVELIEKYKYKKGGGVFFDLKEASLNELHNKFQRCHDEIWEGGKRDPAVSFDEMSKLMFAKIHEGMKSVFLSNSYLYYNNLWYC